MGSSAISLLAKHFKDRGLIGAFSLAPDKGAIEIAKEADRRDVGFGDTSSQMTMTLRNRQGQESIRKIRNQTLEVDGDGDVEDGD